MKWSMWAGLLIVLVAVISGCTANDEKGEDINTGETVCVPNWSCSEWSECTATLTGGVKTRNCSDSNNCGNVSDKPAESQSCELPTTTKEPSELALQLDDLPDGYKVSERGERLKSDVSEKGINWGWKKGYYAYFLNQDENNVFMYTKIEQLNSIYPIENITHVINHDWFEDIEALTVEELSDPKIGDESRAWRIKAEDESLTYTMYRIDFIKYDYYTMLQIWGTTGVDYELLKELAQKVADKIA